MIDGCFDAELMYPTGIVTASSAILILRASPDAECVNFPPGFTVTVLLTDDDLNGP